MVATAGTTGARSGIGDEQLAYFDRIDKMGLEKPRLIGFGISDKATFDTACRYADGAIIGSAFIKQLMADSSDEAIEAFVRRLKNSE
jgi:tryptophan synthase alpha chain